MSLFGSNERTVNIGDRATPLYRRGVAVVQVKPLNVRQEARVEDILQGDALNKMNDPRMKQLIEERRVERDEEPVDRKRVRNVDSYRPAWEYIVYCGVKLVNSTPVPEPPAGMLSNGASDEDGWVSDLSSGECCQLAEIVLDQSGILESKETEGNASVTST